MASGEISSNSSQEGSLNFETIKPQYDQASIELNSLRLQLNEGELQTKRVVEQLDYYRDQYLAAMNQIGQSTLEGSSLRSKYVDINNENIRLQQRIQHLEKKATRHDGNSPAVSNFVEQYNELKKRYDSNRMEYEKLAKEMESCKKICSDLSRDRNSLALEKDELKQQLSSALTQLEATVHDKNMYPEIREKAQHQSDGSAKELSQLLQVRSEELRRMTAQYKAVDLELRTILSEREGVLEENQKLSDDLATTKEELQKIYKEDKSLVYEHERLKRDIDTLSHLRDEVMKERNSLREEVDVLKGRDCLWNDLAESNSKFAISDQQHCLADLEVANKEIEKLRKNLERAKGEIGKSVQETELAKSRRDWAISEREKIVQERDTVKTLCDELRKERDTAVTDLLAAIRDSEQIKKRKDEAVREAEHLREQLESHFPTDRDLQWKYMPLDPLSSADTEIVELDLSSAQQNGDIGIMLDPREEGQGRSSSGVLVIAVAKDSPAYSRLYVGDCIIRIDNFDCTAVPKRIAIEKIRNSFKRCTLVVRRQLVTKSHMYAVQLYTSNNRNHGLTLETGIFISKIAPNSLAANEADLSVGDRVLSINNKTMEGVSSGKEAMAYLEVMRCNSLNIIALKQITQSKKNSAQCKPNRLINICTQTDERMVGDTETLRSTHSTGNSKSSSSKITEMFNKFRGKIHMHSHSNQKGSTASESDSLCQENDAIAVLDSVLNNENSSPAGKIKENIFKRSRKAKKESTKEINKNLGTWPRANIMNITTDQENHTGTIVQHRKKERPALSLFTGPISLGNEEKSVPPITVGKETYFASHSKEATQKSGASNRSSNPIPFHVLYPPPPSVLNRHSVYSALESDSGMHESGKSMPLSNKYCHHHHHYQHQHNPMPNNNRLSLNITPSSMNDSSLIFNSAAMSRKAPPISNVMDFVTMKNSTDSLLNSKSPLSSLDFKPNSMQHQQDLISLKSQNSIESFLGPKSLVPAIDVRHRECPSDFYVPKRSARNGASKFPSDSDSLGVESISSANNSFTSTLPSYATNTRTSALVTASSRSPQRIFSAFPNHLNHPHHLQLTSPLTVANNSSDKLDYEYAHTHGASMDNDHFNRSKVHPVRDRDIIYGSYGHSYEGGTFPRKKENQRVRIPSNPSVASKGSDVKNSTGSIEHGSEHGSPMPPEYKVEILSSGGGGANKRNSVPDYSPSPGDLRRVVINKSAEPLGITIQCNNNGGGIFVSTVTANSIASQVGLQIGDQLLEVCGINMRDATYKIAAKILRQCGNAITMLVQYCPESKQMKTTPLCSLRTIHFLLFRVRRKHSATDR